MFGAGKPFDFGEDREMVNEILVAALKHYGYPFDVAAGECDGNADPLYLLQNAPGLFCVLRAAALVKKGSLSKSDASMLHAFLDGVVSLLARVSAGDELAMNQFKAADKIIFPEQYEVKAAEIESVAQLNHTSPELARGFELRRLMCELSWVVEPEGDYDVLSGPVRLISNPQPGDEEIWEVANEHSASGMTLQSLAIRVYNYRLQDKGLDAKDESSLDRDLRRVKEWEETLTPEERNGGVLIRNGDNFLCLPVQDYPEGWEKARNKGGDKLPKSLSHSKRTTSAIRRMRLKF